MQGQSNGHCMISDILSFIRSFHILYCLQETFIMYIYINWAVRLMYHTMCEKNKFLLAYVAFLRLQGNSNLYLFIISCYIYVYNVSLKYTVVKTK